MPLEWDSLTPPISAASAKRKRRIIPSMELGSPRKYYIVSEKGARPVEDNIELTDLPSFFSYEDLFSSDHADDDSRTTVPHANIDPQEYPVEAERPGHIILPFRRQRAHCPNRTVQLLHFRLHDDLDYRYIPAKKRRVFDLVKEYFAVARIGITEVQNWRNVVVIVLENDDTDMTVVPKAIATCPCNYLFESEMGRQKGPKIKKGPNKRGRKKKPRVDFYDHSEYTVLRPGIMLAGKNEDSEDQPRTTAGILVKDNMGNKYMTVTSNGFSQGSRVFHPDAHGREIGETVKKLDNTDIALVRLHEGETFTNEFFESSHMLRPPPQLKGFERAEELIPVDFVYMDNSFTGYMEGTAGCNGFTRVAADGSVGPETDWVQTRWDYMGQGFSEHYVDGARGSVIWDGDGMVLGLFSFAPVSGHFLDWCQSVPADCLIDAEYTVV